MRNILFKDCALILLIKNKQLKLQFVVIDGLLLNNNNVMSCQP
jgi:hypothetical protein